jgi:hypothetical protein
MTQPIIDAKTVEGEQRFVVDAEGGTFAVPTAAAIALAESILLRFGDQDKALMSWLGRHAEELKMQVRQLNAENRELRGVLDECDVLFKKLQASGVVVEMPEPANDGNGLLQ